MLKILEALYHKTNQTSASFCLFFKFTATMSALNSSASLKNNEEDKEEQK